VGFDEDPQTLRGVADGTIQSTVVQQPYEFGYQSMIDMVKYHQRRPVVHSGQQTYYHPDPGDRENECGPVPGVDEGTLEKVGSMSGTLLELVSITKMYPGVTALDDITMVVGRGEVLGLIGENGAGKSTLMKILGGIVTPTSGSIRVDGQEHARFTVNESMRAGIAFVHQELNLFENLDVAANMAWAVSRLASAR